jgi:hypothetical protein
MSWERSYQEVLKAPPTGLLIARDGGPVKINVELVEGKPPFVYGYAYVHNVVGEEPAWYLQGENHVQGHGWKAILLPRAREKHMAHPETLYSLRVVRVSQSGRSLLMELV